MSVIWHDLECGSYREDLELWQGDHLSLVNWQYPLAGRLTTAPDPQPRYSGIIRRLADLGF